VEIEEFPQAKEATDVKVQDQNIVGPLFRQGYHPLEFVPKRATVNQKFYVEVLKMLIDAVRLKRGGRVVERSLIDSSP
jgi:hypothetical protein